MTSLILITVVAVFAIGIVVFLQWNHRQQQKHLESARRDFSRRREWLEADFLSHAANSGKPRGLEWVNCDFADAITFARNRTNGQLRALVGITIQFQAVAGGDMEDVPAVANLRSATAVFHHINGKWSSDGRVVFNLDPAEAVRHFQHELDLV